jgi:transcriptional regulator with XRE-family HTH domain
MSQIKMFRLLAGISQEKLAEQLGISQSYLSLLERNKKVITPEVNRKIESVLGLLLNK